MHITLVALKVVVKKSTKNEILCKLFENVELNHNTLFKRMHEIIERLKKNKFVYKS